MLARFAYGAAAACLAAGVSGQQIDVGPQDESNASPNATNSVTFNPSAIQGQSSSQWTWRLNVSSVSVTSNSGLEDPHVVETTWDLSFGDEPSIQESIQNTTAACAGIVVRRDWPLNVTRNFTSSDGSCDDVLGSACVAAIIAGSLWDNSTQSCSSRNLALHDIPACRDTLLKDDPSLLTSVSNLLIEDIASGQGIVKITSEAHAGTEGEAYYTQALDELHIAILDMIAGGPGQLYGSRLAVCNMINRGGPADDDDEGSEDSGEDSGEDEEDSEGGNSASGAHSNDVWAVGVLVAGAAAALATLI